MIYTLRFWTRWAWRDLQERWVQVGIIAAIIGLGTGVYAGLGETTPWRFEAADRSFEQLHMHDLRIALTQSSYVDAGQLRTAVQSIPHADWLQAVEPRLIADRYVSVTHGGKDILVRGRIVSVDVTAGELDVNKVAIRGGRNLALDDDGLPRAILDYHFAAYYDLPPQGQVTISGGQTLDYVGRGLSPEYFFIITPEGGFMAQANFAVLFVPLATAQMLAGQPDMANDTVLTLAPGADMAQARQEIEAALKATFPDVGFTITTRTEDVSYKMVYDQIEMNQQVYDIIAWLCLIGATLGAFNLASRVVESQRRQIGIGMALGMPPRLLVIRPLLVGAEIALIGTLLGVALGLGFGELAAHWLSGLIPLPAYGRVFHPGVFTEAVALGLVLPVIATIYPVWRAARVLPVDAIKTGHLMSRSSGLAPRIVHLPVPGRSFVQMPVRNLLRAPRRTLLTVFGIATAITTLVGLAGMLDSVMFTLDEIGDESYQNYPNRMTVLLNGFYPGDSAPVQAITGSSAVSIASPGIRVPAQLSNGQAEFDVLLEALDLDSVLWSPTLQAGQQPTAESERVGILISPKAADDLGVGVGDTLQLEHPRRQGLFAYEIVTSQVMVAGIHTGHFRTYVYIDQADADLIGISGLVNLLHVNPAEGVTQDGVKQALFAEDSVAAVVSVRDAIASTRQIFDEVIKFLSAVQSGIVLMAFLIALNSTVINLGERAREIATMFAFGLPVYRVALMVMLESLLVGIVGTLIGTGLGALVTIWFFSARMTIIMPDVSFAVTLSPRTLVLAIGVGVVVVTLAPLFAVRAMRRMDIPSTLRVME